MAKYVLLFQGGWPVPSEQEAFIAKFEQWMGSVVGSGKMVSGERLRPTGRVVSKGGVSDLQVGLNVSGGFIVVEARNYDEAVSVAGGCPLLANGGHIEIRETEPMEQ